MRLSFYISQQLKRLGTIESYYLTLHIYIPIKAGPGRNVSFKTGHTHWYLVVILVEEGKIYHLDSHLEPEDMAQRTDAI